MRVKLNIEAIPEGLYDAILQEFRQVYGENFTFNDWEISATADEVNIDEEIREASHAI